MQPQQGHRQQSLQNAVAPQQLAALQTLSTYGANSYLPSQQTSQNQYAQLALAQNSQLQAQIAQAQRAMPQQARIILWDSPPIGALTSDLIAAVVH